MEDEIIWFNGADKGYSESWVSWTNEKNWRYEITCWTIERK
jgi:hypothetical protein